MESKTVQTNWERIEDPFGSAPPPWARASGPVSQAQNRQLGKISFGNLARFHSATWQTREIVKNEYFSLGFGKTQ
jgi:hypothetical protein